MRHKLRLAVSTSYWPIAWPAPTNTCLTIYSGLSLLKLPVLGKNATTEALTDFSKNTLVEEELTTTMREASHNRKFSFNTKQNVNVIRSKS